MNYLIHKEKNKEWFYNIVLKHICKTKSASTFEPDLNLILASRSMISICFVILADQRPHRSLAMLDPVLKMASEELTLIHQVYSFLVPSVTLPRWYNNSPFLLALRPKPPARPLLTLIISSPPSWCHIQSFSYQPKEELGFFCFWPFPFWPILVPLLAYY